MTEQQINQLLGLLEQGGIIAAILFGLQILVTPVCWLLAAWLISRVLGSVFEVVKHASWAESVCVKIRAHILPRLAYGPISGSEQEAIAKWVDKKIAEDTSHD